MNDFLLRGARLTDDAPLQDIHITDGRIAALTDHDPAALSEPGADAWHLDGRVVLPGMVDIHTHLDKTYSTIANASGTLQEAIDVWVDYKQGRTPDDIRNAVNRALRNAVSHGVTAMRSHLNAENQGDLATIALMLELREAWKDAISLQFVALGHPGESAAHDAVMHEALKMGVDLIGGAPALRDDPQAAVDAAFAMAEATGHPIDLHIDETEDPNMLTLERVAERTLAHGMAGYVTAGHCCSLAFVETTSAMWVMERVAAAGMTLVTLPSCNLVLMGRGMKPAPRGVTLVKELLAHGVNVCAASDNVHDPFNPFGAYDLLQIANLNAHVAHMTGEDELYTCVDLVTHNPARAFGEAPGAIVEGAVADLVVVDARRVLDAVVSPPARLATFKAGRRVVRTAIEQTWDETLFCYDK